VLADGADRSGAGAGRGGDGPTRARLPGAHRRRRPDRAAGVDARGVPQDARAADLAARALRDRRDAPRGELGDARPHPRAEGDPPRQGAGRGGARALPVQRGRDAGRVARRAHRAAQHGEGQVLEHLQLPHAHLGRHGDDRLAGGRRGDHEPGAAAALLVRPLRAGDGAHLQGGELPPAAGLPVARHALPGHGRAEGDGAGRARPVVVAVAHDVRPAGRRVGAQRAVGQVEDQAVHQRRAAAALRGPDGAAGRVPGAHRARPEPALERRARALRLRRDRLGGVLRGAQGQRPLQPRAAAGPRVGARRRPVGARRRGGVRREARGRRGARRGRL
ncbi:MAG: 1,2-phenylacetyl-CoA epoxidase, subunit A, partial [uncultured Gemmatimonadaceae bacterium]